MEDIKRKLETLEQNWHILLEMWKQADAEYAAALRALPLSDDDGRADVSETLGRRARALNYAAIAASEAFRDASSE